MATLVSELVQEYAIVMDDDGRVIHNSFQMDDPVIMQKYDDGTLHLLSTKTGRLIVAPYRPSEAERMRCPHCNGELGGSA